jgi:hypothetical protein
MHQFLERQQQQQNNIKKKVERATGNCNQDGRMNFEKLILEN